MYAALAGETDGSPGQHPLDREGRGDLGAGRRRPITALSHPQPRMAEFSPQSPEHSAQAGQALEGALDRVQRLPVPAGPLAPLSRGASRLWVSVNSSLEWGEVGSPCLTPFQPHGPFSCSLTPPHGPRPYLGGLCFCCTPPASPAHVSTPSPPSVLVPG